MAFWSGYLAGLSMVVFIGPVFFTLLNSSLAYGGWAGFWVAMGIIVSDVACVAICTAGAVPLFSDPHYQRWLALAGGLLLVVMGLKYLVRPPQPAEAPPVLRTAHYTAFFAKGFLVNFVNPFVFFVWIGVAGYARSVYSGWSQVILFLSAALLGILTTDLTKVILARQLKKIITPRTLRWLSFISGLAIIGFGIRLFVFAAGY